ncbi:MAG TPA: type II secretion system F family protein [Actinomycetota bacterium]
MSAIVAVLLLSAAACAELGTRAWRHDVAVAALVPASRSNALAIGPGLLGRVQTHLSALPAWAPWASAAGTIVGVVTRGFLVGLFAAAGVACAWAVRARRQRVRAGAQRDEQLADAVRAVSSSLRAGMSTSQAIGYAESESRPPLRASLEAMNRSLQLGEPFDDALDHWSATVDTDDARLVAGVLRLHRRSGGDLPTVLDQVAGTLRERQAAAGEVRALTSQARLSGAILGVLPVGFFAFLWLTSREQIEGAFHTPTGIAALILGLVLEGLAFVWIRRLLEVR